MARGAHIPPPPAPSSDDAIYVRHALPPATRRDVRAVNSKMQEDSPEWRSERTVFQNWHKDLGHDQYSRRIVHLFVRVDDHGTVIKVSARDEVQWRLTRIKVCSGWR
jgi:hypothetical protein